MHRRNLIALIIIFSLIATTLFADTASDASKLIDKRQFNEAIDMLKRKIEKDPSYDKLYFQLGRAYFLKGDIDLAETEFKNCLDRKRKHEGAKYYLGRVYVINKKWEDAKKIFDDGIQKSNKNKGMFLNGLGLYHLAKGEYSDADLAFRKALIEEPDNLEYRRNLADVNFENRVYGVAISGYQEVLVEDSTDMLAHFKLGKALFNQKLFSDAIVSLSRAIELDSNYLESYKLSGDIFMLFGLSTNGGGGEEAQKRFTSAIWMYEKYTELGGELTPEIAYRLGQAYYQAFGYELAVEYLSKSIELGYEKNNAYNLKATALFRLKHFDEAIAAYDEYEQKVSGGNPDYEWTITDYNFFKERAKTFYQLWLDSEMTEKTDSLYLDRAIPSYEQAIALKDDDLALYGEVGLAYYHLGYYDKAIEWFERKITQDSTAFRTYLNMSYCYLKTKDYPAAMEKMAKATEIKPDYCSAYKTIANTYLHQIKDMLEAKKWLLKWAECDTLDHEPYKWLGYMDISSKPPKKDSAIKYLLKAWSLMQKNGTDPCSEFDIIKWLAQAYNMYDESDKEDEACKWARRGLRCKPNDKVLKDIAEACE